MNSMTNNKRKQDLVDLKQLEEHISKKIKTDPQPMTLTNKPPLNPEAIPLKNTNPLPIHQIDPSLTDYNIIYQSKSLYRRPCSKYILSTVSHTINALILLQETHNRGSCLNEIVLKFEDEDFVEGFDAVLCVSHQLKLKDVTIKTLISVLKVANCYLMDVSIYEWVLKQIRKLKYITLEQLITIENLPIPPDIEYSTDIRSYCMDLILSKWDEFTQRDSISSLYSFSLQQIERMTKAMKDENDKFTMIMMWIEADEVNRKSNLESLLSNVNFSKMNNHFVLDAVGYFASQFDCLRDMWISIAQCLPLKNHVEREFEINLNVNVDTGEKIEKIDCIRKGYRFDINSRFEKQKILVELEISLFSDDLGIEVPFVLPIDLKMNMRDVKNGNIIKQISQNISNQNNKLQIQFDFDGIQNLKCIETVVAVRSQILNETSI
eukprot:TRINITY_DN25128_c0_g1_i1.p1 TRINITY_DN25128_c0_g1~~TRINITY_DN25128_c0_g1_i1.p1  ORF type:complete len:435 (-),score=131.19 TRINITY_DN25128_c0_g1_i1:112-1416(-)